MGALIDLEGQKFGRLLATNKIRKIHSSSRRLCRCDCGNKTWVTTTHLTNGRRVSCGCAPGRKLPFGQSSKNEILNTYKQRAKQLGFTWVLSKREFLSFVTDVCFYCGRAPSNLKKSKFNNGDFVYNGIDRRDNTLGYTRQNSVTCCLVCNRAKGQMTVAEFVCWVKNISDRLL